LFAIDAIEISGGFVGKKLRTINERACQSAALLLTAG